MTKSVFTESYKKLCELLVDARKNASMTQQQVANKLNRPQSFVTKYEKGERRLDIIELIEIVDILNIDIIKIIKAIQKN